MDTAYEPGPGTAPTTGRFRIVTAPTGMRTVIVHVAGAADHDVCHRLRAALSEALAQAPAMLIVDLTALTFCDSAGLNALLDANTAAEAAGIWMVLVGAGPQPLHLLALTGTDRVFTVRPHLRAVRPPVPVPAQR